MQKIKTECLQRFIDKAKQVTRLESLTPELVHEFIEFIEKIVVSAPVITRTASVIRKLRSTTTVWYCQRADS